MPKLSDAQKRVLRTMRDYDCFAVQDLRGHCYYLPIKSGGCSPYAIWNSSVRGNTLVSLEQRELLSIADVGDRSSRGTRFYGLTPKGREVAKELEEQDGETK